MAKVACNFVCAGDGMLLPLVQQTERQRATQMLAPTLSSEPKKKRFSVTAGLNHREELWTHIVECPFKMDVFAACCISLFHF